MEHKHNRELYYNHNLASPEESREKKNLHLPPPELNGRWNVGPLEKEGSKKKYFFLNGPAIKRRFFLRLPYCNASYIEYNQELYFLYFPIS